MSSFSSFYLKPAGHEQIETVVHIKSDPRPSLIGVVKNESEDPVDGALVALFEAAAEGDIHKLVSSQYTDPEGQFIFGPLEAGRLYAVRVYKENGKTRFLSQP